ncbi:hypothetical protein O181_028299 [Austropuccinia psidii MF-1]|uniref:Uncharacterized protein n=1 Tax=Austropuccinia psidii MF-1 TaxID=1389203 RepID=A0A9Q3CQF4_9BASI|nr:hypothetical protein [Austropuccinia psidii MF-1]
MASGNHQRPPDQLRKLFPQLKGNSFHSSMHPVLKVAGVVHIWYYIPLCTIFAQQFNGEAFRTKSHNSKSSSQNPKPISKEDSLTHQSGNPWRQSEDHSRIPITWPCRSWVGNFIQDYSKGILRGYTVSQAVFKASSISILLGQLNWSIQASINQPVCSWPNWANSITQFHFHNGQNCIGPIQTIQPVIHLPGSSFQFFTYTGHLSEPGDLLPS